VKDNLHTALVLQGGGALGAYEYGAIKALYERRSGFSPSVITGLSIGAVNGAILAGAADPIRTLDKVWREDFEVLFPLPLSPLPFEAIYQSLIPAILQQKIVELNRHRKIDAFTMIPFNTRPEFTQATDFSKSSIEHRIEAGYQEAVKQQIWDPKWVQP